MVARVEFRDSRPSAEIKIHVPKKILSADATVNVLWNYGISFTHNTFLQSQKNQISFSAELKRDF